MSNDTTAAVHGALAAVSGRPADECARPGALLERDLGLDSLALLELVETLQSRLEIVVPDEMTARLRTVADLADTVARLTATAPTTPGTTP